MKHMTGVPASTPPTSPPPPPALETETALDAATDWLNYPILSNPLSAWLLSILFAGLLYVGLRVAQGIIVNRLRRLDRLSTRVGNLPHKLIGDIRGWCILAVAVFAASRVLALPSSAAMGIRLLLIVAVSAQVLLTSRIVVDFVIGQAMKRAKTPDGHPDPSIASASGIIRFMTMLVLGALLVLLALANMGIEVTPLITGLGIGGVAVALAAQSVLTDVFGSLTILFDKPFLVGDFIVVGQQMGTVEAIGVKTTRVRALSGEQLVFSNSDLLASRIQNYKRMAERRVAFTLVVSRETPPELAERAAAILRDSVVARRQVRFDRAHLSKFGTYGLEYEVVYYVLSPDYNVYMDIQQGINIDIMREFADAGIEVAYLVALPARRVEGVVKEAEAESGRGASGA